MLQMQEKKSCLKHFVQNGRNLSIFLDTQDVLQRCIRLKVCVFGRIIARQSGDPDGFTNKNSKVRATSPTLEGNYVDGVSLTYGRDPWNHIWTFAASFSVVAGCGRCEDHIPMVIIESNYTCETTQRLCGGTSVCTGSLWIGGSCPPRNATFYRELSESTTY